MEKVSDAFNMFAMKGSKKQREVFGHVMPAMIANLPEMIDAMHPTSFG